MLIYSTLDKYNAIIKLRVSQVTLKKINVMFYRNSNTPTVFKGDVMTVIK